MFARQKVEGQTHINHAGFQVGQDGRCLVQGMPGVYVAGVVLEDGFSTVDGLGGPLLKIDDLAGLQRGICEALVCHSAHLTGAALRLARETLHLTAYELDMILGYRPGTISNWENGSEQAIPTPSDRALRYLVANRLRIRSFPLPVSILDMSEMRMTRRDGRWTCLLDGPNFAFAPRDIFSNDETGKDLMSESAWRAILSCRIQTAQDGAHPLGDVLLGRGVPVGGSIQRTLRDARETGVNYAGSTSHLLIEPERKLITDVASDLGVSPEHLRRALIRHPESSSIPFRNADNKVVRHVGLPITAALAIWRPAH